MKYQTFYDLMDLYSDDRVDLGDAGLTDADRITRMTMEKLGPMAVTAPPRRRKRPVRRMVTAIAAAVLALGLSVTAYAVYQARMADYIIPEATATAEASREASHEASNEASPETLATEIPTRATISLVGYQGTPEYAAYTEWTDWRTEHPFDFSSVGGDDSYYETPQNYAYLYQAYFRPEAEALDEIVAKYGLTLLEDRHFVYAPEEVYDALGTEAFLPEGAGGAGYIYNNGTFKLEAMTLNGLEASMYTSVKGSFSMISSSFAKEYEEWSYTTASGRTVDLVWAAYSSMILFESDGAYIRVSIDAGSEAEYDPAKDPSMDKEWFMNAMKTLLKQGGIEIDEEALEQDWEQHVEDNLRFAQMFPPVPVTKEELEAIADTIDFDLLAQRFAGTHNMTDEEYAAFVQRLENATDSYNRDDTVDEAIAAIGDFYLADMPEGYFMYIVTSSVPSDIGSDGGYYVGRGYDGPRSTIGFSWHSLNNTLADPTNPWSYVGASPMATLSEAIVNGYACAVEAIEMDRYDGNAYLLTWVDTDRALVFTLSTSGSGNAGCFTLEEAIAMAESVTER